MNQNRQNNCYSAPTGAGCGGRSGARPSRPVPANVITPCGNPVVKCIDVQPVSVTPCCSDVRPVPCCSDVSPARPVPCCSDVIGGGIIIGPGNRGCDKENVLSGLPVAMAYVPWQSYGNLYPMNQALRSGTLFRELDLDFAGRRCN